MNRGLACATCRGWFLRWTPPQHQLAACRVANMVTHNLLYRFACGSIRRFVDSVVHARHLCSLVYRPRTTLTWAGLALVVRTALPPFMQPLFWDRPYLPRVVAADVTRLTPPARFILRCYSTYLAQSPLLTYRLFRPRHAFLSPVRRTRVRALAFTRAARCRN